MYTYLHKRMKPLYSITWLREDDRTENKRAQGELSAAFVGKGNYKVKYKGVCIIIEGRTVSRNLENCPIELENKSSIVKDY